MTAAPGPQQPDEVRSPCPCNLRAASVCAYARDAGICTRPGQHADPQFRPAAPPAQPGYEAEPVTPTTGTSRAHNPAIAAQPDEVPTLDRLASWLNEHPELTGVTDGTRFIGSTPAQPDRDTEEGRR